MFLESPHVLRTGLGRETSVYKRGKTEAERVQRAAKDVRVGPRHKQTATDLKSFHFPRARGIG